MSKIKINVYTNMNGIVEKKKIDAIIVNDVIKCIDETNNKFLIDIKNNILEKVNNDINVKLDFSKNEALILIKEFNKEFRKDIIVLELKSTKNSFFVKYKLIEENIVNEYKVKIL